MDRIFGSDANASVMGDIVLLQDEVNKVISKLRASGFDRSLPRQSQTKSISFFGL